MKRWNECPLCNSTELTNYLNCQDYTVSNETFTLQQCQACDFVFTNPRPEDAELGKYYESQDYVSHSDKPRTLFDKAYQIARTFTLRWKYNLIQRHSLTAPKTILDYGCGTGSFLKYAKDKAMTVSGVEPSDKAREIACATTGVRILPAITEISHTYDVITLWHVLEHVSELHETVERLRNALDKKGTMFIAVPNLNSADATKYREYWAAYDVPRHLWHFSEKTMTNLLEKHGMKVIDTIPMRLDAYYVAMLSEKYKTGSMNKLSAFINAANSNSSASKTGQYSSLIYKVRK